MSGRILYKACAQTKQKICTARGPSNREHLGLSLQTNFRQEYERVGRPLFLYNTSKTRPAAASGGPCECPTDVLILNLHWHGEFLKTVHRKGSIGPASSAAHCSDGSCCTAERGVLASCAGTCPKLAPNNLYVLHALQNPAERVPDLPDP